MSYDLLALRPLSLHRTCEYIFFFCLLVCYARCIFTLFEDDCASHCVLGRGIRNEKGRGHFREMDSEIRRIRRSEDKQMYFLSTTLCSCKVDLIKKHDVAEF